MKYYYPAIFEPKGSGLEGYTLRFPDIPGCFTMGDDMTECLWMAQDAIGLMLDDVDEKNYPAPSNIDGIELKDCPEGSFVKVVCFDKEKYDADTANPIKSASSCAGLNISQTAELLGAPYRTVQNWFNGTSRPSPWVERLVIEKIQGTL
jgi:predicted RNase H-like HicB family nuclease